MKIKLNSLDSIPSMLDEISDLTENVKVDDSHSEMRLDKIQTLVRQIKGLYEKEIKIRSRSL